MIILAAVTSSTVSQVLLDEKAAFTVPPYELRSAAGVSSLYHLQDLLFSVGSSCPEYTEWLIFAHWGACLMIWISSWRSFGGFCIMISLKFWADYCILIHTHCQKLIKLVGCNGS
jgi:hypothetical protein